MAATSYAYTVSTDIPSGVVSVARLIQEIELSTILTQIDYNAGGVTLLNNGEDLTIWFKDPLSSTDKQTLDGSTSQTPNSPATGGSILGDHTGNPLPDDPQDVNVLGGSVSIDGAVDGDGKIKSPDGLTFLGDNTNPVRTDPTGTTTQPVSAASLPLPAGAATEATLATRAADRTTAPAPHAVRVSDGSVFINPTTPADTQPISAASLPLPAGAATEATLATKAEDRTTAISPHAARLSDGTAFYKPTTPADTQPISAAALPLPAGAATETTLATRASESTLSSRASEATVATLGTEATLATRASESTLSALVSNIGSGASPVADTLQARVQETIDLLTTIDSDTSSLSANADVARSTRASESSLSTLITNIGSGASPAVDTLQARVQELIDSLGEAVASPVADTVQARLQEVIDNLVDLISGTGVKQGTKAANSGAWPIKITSSDGTKTVTITTDTGVDRLEVSGKVQITGAIPPPSTTPQNIFGDTPLTVGTQDTTFVIPNGETFYLQELAAGNEDPTKGAVIELLFYDVSEATEHIITRIYTSGNTIVRGFNDRSVARDGTPLLGNGSDYLILRRTKYTGTNIAIDATVTGYTV